MCREKHTLLDKVYEINIIKGVLGALHSIIEGKMSAVLAP